MKKIYFLPLFVLAGLLCVINTNGQIKIGNKKINTEKIISAGSDVASAITLTDADIAKISKEYIDWMDTNNAVASDDSEMGTRLKRLTDQFREVDGMKLNFKVYEVADVNAFACGDGSIRVCGGLMEVMDDSGLLAVLGHEIGHVVHSDTKDAMKNAYLSSAVKNAVGATGGVPAKLTDSQLGTLAQSLAGAQFSQKQEGEADDYAFDFCVKNSIDPYAMSNALNKLVELSGSGTEKSSKVSQMFSTHPDSAKRAARMKEKADKHTGK